MESQRALLPAVDDFDVKRVEPVHAERFDDGLLGRKGVPYGDKTTVPAPTTTWNESQISDLVLELLADLLDEDIDDRRRDLLHKGATMPVDSLNLFDILVDFRQRTGLRIPKRKLRRRDMRSVDAFAKFAAREARP